MRFSPLRARGLGLILLLASGAAQAAEVMHMPFDCAFDGVRVDLRPSEDRTYAVIGRREHEILTACSPADQQRCGSWLVHRFDFDCNGARVAWLDAAAAASHFADWDAWVEDGRFRMRMSPAWGVARERPHFPRRRWMRRHDMPREDAFAGSEDAYGAPRIVTAPPGYAPAVGIPLTFSGGEPDVAETSEAPAPAVAASAAEPEHQPIPDLPERAPPREQRLAAASPPVVAPAPKPASVPAAKVAAARDMPAPATIEAPDAGDATNSNGKTAPAKTGGFTIINGPHAAAAEPPTSAPAAASAPAVASTHPDKPAAPIETGAVKSPAADGLKPTPTATVNSDAIADATLAPSAPESAPQPRVEMPLLSPETVTAAAATTLALAGLMIFGIRRWTRRRPETPPADRDIASISFGGGGKATTLAIERVPATTDAPEAENHSPETGEVAGDLPVPATYAEALAVLGASPDASTGAIKKIVDGLRQSWHPDLARSEADRLHREARVRQINVAWDLVSQRRSAA